MAAEPGAQPVELIDGHIVDNRMCPEPPHPQRWLGGPRDRAAAGGALPDEAGIGATPHSRANDHRAFSRSFVEMVVNSVG